MTTKVRGFFVTMAALLALSTAVPSALAGGGAQNALTSNTQAWTTYGNVVQASSSATYPGMFTSLRSTQDQQAYAYKDLDISQLEGNYIVVSAYTRAENIRQNGDITGLPYIYGYIFNQDDTIRTYMSGPAMRHYGTTDGEWILSYGVYYREDADKVRLFLNQAKHQDTVVDDREAAFYAPAVMLLNSSRDVANFLHARRDYLPEVEAATSLLENKTVTAVPSHQTVSFTVYHLIKTATSPAIWMINDKDQSRHVFVNEEIYKTYDTNWSQYSVVSAATLNSYTEGLPALPHHRYVQAGDSAVKWSNGINLYYVNGQPEERFIVQVPSWFSQLFSF